MDTYIRSSIKICHKNICEAIGFSQSTFLLKYYNRCPREYRLAIENYFTREENFSTNVFTNFRMFKELSAQRRIQLIDKRFRDRPVRIPMSFFYLLLRYLQVLLVSDRDQFVLDQQTNVEPKQANRL